MSRMDEWDSADFYLSNTIGIATAQREHMRSVSSSLIALGFPHDTKEIASDIAAIEQAQDEIIATLRRALGTREDYARGLEDHDREAAADLRRGE